jgi:hypothetical protein
LSSRAIACAVVEFRLSRQMRSTQLRLLIEERRYHNPRNS